MRTDMTIWAPGMRCVCVDDSPSSHPFLFAHFVTKGAVYTVRDVFKTNAKGGFSLRFVEIVNPVSEYIIPVAEPIYGGWRFRPLSETRLDQFRKHLNRIPADRVPA